MKNLFARYVLLVLLVLCIGSAYAHADEDDDSTGLPVPRFVSLRSGDINMRVGPGTRYSINWVYKREGLPVEIIQEFEQWRKIRDSDGTVGWVHKQMLQGRRSMIVKAPIGVMRRAPEPHGTPLLRAERGVIGRLLECEKDWCRVQISGRKGWILKNEMWGAYAAEEF
jgi:SH3-like domain-containing protein